MSGPKNSDPANIWEIITSEKATRIIGIITPLLVATVVVLQIITGESIKGSVAIEVAGINTASDERVATLVNGMGLIELAVEEEIGKAEVAISQDLAQLEQTRFDEGVKQFKYSTFEKYIPMLMNPDEETRNEAIAVLLILFPKDSEDIFSTVNEVLSGDPTINLDSAIENAVVVSEQAGVWIVVIANYTDEVDFNKVESGVEGSISHGYTPTVYTIENYYVVSLGPFPSYEAAESVKLIARGDYPGAYLLNMKYACPVPKWRDEGYFECFTSE